MYYFCSEGCARAFESDPSRYVTPAQPPIARRQW
jgi:YHS domain-containing protein